MNVLVVDPSFLPIKIIDWEEAMKCITTYRFKILLESDEIIHSAYREWRIPEIIISPKKLEIFNYAKFDYDYIFNRDNYTCAYCGYQFSFKHLTVDHILPRSKGGKNSWDNCICSCFYCNNSIKKNLTLKESGLKLLFNPYIPKNTLEKSLIKMKFKDNWLEYLPPKIASFIETLRSRTILVDKN